ncbi:MAG: hypothetical protein P1V51_24615 [Deltaproteobacteria bacterium]|nr:hypothetical protein [Deltaproteobacteria bacterium]
MSNSSRRPSGLTLVTGVVYAGFALALVLKIAGGLAVPPELVVALAVLGLAGALRLLVRASSGVLGHGPPQASMGSSIRCEGEDAERVRRAALKREGTGGGGQIARWAMIFPLLVHLSVALVFLSGLLNVLFHTEGRWVQFAGGGKDLDLLETYQELDLGLLADPSDLRYGVILGEIRPGEPERLFDMKVVDSSGKTLQEGPRAVRSVVPLGNTSLYQWGMGPGVRLTLLQRERGRLFDQPVVLWPTPGKPGRFHENLESGNLKLMVSVSGWPPAGGEAPRVFAGVYQREGERERALVPNQRVEPSSVTEGEEGYAVIVWEVRSYLGLGIVRGTHQTLTRVGLLGVLLGLLGWALFRPTHFVYEEQEDGAILVSPPRAWARLQRGGKS